MILGIALEKVGCGIAYDGTCEDKNARYLSMRLSTCARQEVREKRQKSTAHLTPIE